MTKTGNNIFPGVRRIWVTDPRTGITPTPIISTVSTGTTTVVTPTPTPTTPTVTYSEIDAAY